MRIGHFSIKRRPGELARRQPFGFMLERWGWSIGFLWVAFSWINHKKLTQQLDEELSGLSGWDDVEEEPA